MIGDDQVQIALGTVGWDGDPDVSVSSHGVVTIKVTLFDGRNLYEKPQQGKAQGRQIEARMSVPFFTACGLPQQGSKVVVAIPGGWDMMAGAAVVLGRLDDDGAAVALAKASAIVDLQSAIATWAPTGVGDGASLKAALATWLANNYATTHFKGR